jgi:hypothetical protein
MGSQDASAAFSCNDQPFTFTQTIATNGRT